MKILVLNGSPRANEMFADFYELYKRSAYDYEAMNCLERIKLLQSGRIYRKLEELYNSIMNQIEIKENESLIFK